MREPGAALSSLPSPLVPFLPGEEGCRSPAQYLSALARSAEEEGRQPGAAARRWDFASRQRSLRGFRCSAGRVKTRAARWGGGRCQSGARCVVLKHFRGSRNLSQPGTAPPSDTDVILGAQAVGRAAVPHD